MNWINAPSMRRYSAPTAAENGAKGIWYAEYAGIFTRREFIIWAEGRVAVAPYDLAFREADEPIKPPPLAGVTPISLLAFESLWEKTA